MLALGTEEGDVDQPQVGGCVLVIADVITFRVRSADSGDRLAVVEIFAPPGGGPPPMHSHPPDELFTVLSGAVTVFSGDPLMPERRELATGDLAHVPGGVAHTFRNFGEHPARLLLTFSPGEVMEQFFLRAGVPVEDPRDPPVVDLDAEVRRVFEAGASLGLRQFDAAYA